MFEYYSSYSSSSKRLSKLLRLVADSCLFCPDCPLTSLSGNGSYCWPDLGLCLLNLTLLAGLHSDSSPLAACSKQWLRADLKHLSVSGFVSLCLCSFAESNFKLGTFVLQLSPPRSVRHSIFCCGLVAVCWILCS